MTSPRHALAMAVAIVSYDTKDVLEPCLRSVAAAGALETVVVDNGSTDGSIELVRQSFPDVVLVVNERNRGYGAAANQAIAACTAPAVLLLNSDTVLAPGALAELGGYLAAHPRAGVVGPRLANADGSLQRSTFDYPSAGDMLLGETGLHLLVARLPGVRERCLRTWAHDEARAVPWLRGAALAIRRSAFDAVGGFDEEFFMYWEEVDLSRRMAAAGFATHFAPVTTVVHVRAQSTSRHACAMRREWLIGFGRYLRRHEPPRTRVTLLALLRALALARARRDALLLRVVRDEQRRASVRAGLNCSNELLAERELWKP
jgi:GT2 family glycosyltransferase